MDEITFDVKRGDDLVRVHIKDEFATIRVAMIEDVWPICEAINRAIVAGAKRGAMFTGMIVHEHTAAMHMMRSQMGITWLGGRVTFLGMLSNGPEFRIDWDEFPTVVE